MIVIRRAIIPIVKPLFVKIQFLQWWAFVLTWNVDCLVWANCAWITISMFIQTVSVIIPIEQCFVKSNFDHCCQGHAILGEGPTLYVHRGHAGRYLGNSSSSLNLRMFAHWNEFYRAVKQTWKAWKMSTIKLDFYIHTRCQIDRGSIKTLHCTWKSFNWRLIRFPN